MNTILKRSIFAILFFFSIGVIYYSPMSIVGGSPMLFAFLCLLGVIVSLISFLVTFNTKGEEMSPALKNVLLFVFLGGGAGMIPGTIFTGIHFENAKSNYLLENGTVGKALVSNKKHLALNTKKRDSEGFEIYITYSNQEQNTISVYDIVSEEEYRSVSQGDSIFIIYSEDKPDVVDFIITDEDREIYSEMF